MDLFKKKKKIVTHSGGFHPDDVFAVAALSILEGGLIKIVRSRDQKDFESGDYVVDVGGVYDAERRRFDHHQTGGAGVRQSGTPYAAFGLVWKEYGDKISGSKEVADRLDKKLVEPTDALDNGFLPPQPLALDIFAYDLYSAVFAFHSTWKEKNRDVDAEFIKLVEYARVLLCREIKRMTDKLEGEHLVEEAYNFSQDKRVVVLDVDYSWNDVLSKHEEPFFVVYPANNVWHVSAVRDKPKTFINRKNFPAAWAGLRDAELQKVTGVPDAVFCHNKLFLVVSRSKEGAKALAEKAVAA